MDSILDILTNPILIFALIGIISSLFRKKKTEEEEQNKRQQQPQQTQTRSSYPNTEDYRQETTPKQVEAKPQFDWDLDIFGEKREELEKKVRDTLSPYMEKKKEQSNKIQGKLNDDVKELSIRGQEISNNSPILKQELQLSEGRVVHSKNRVTAKKVVDGVIWSEILGKPRSRKPHSPIYTQHYPASRKKG